MRLIFRLFLIAGLTFGLIEITARTYLYFSQDGIQLYRNYSFTRAANINQGDPELGYRLLPNVARNALTSDFNVVYRTNSHGFRDREWTPAAGRQRVLFLGDSFTFGEGVESEDRFVDLIAKARPDFQLLNSGVPGYGIHQMTKWFIREGKRLGPRIVVCALIEADIMRTIYWETGQKHPPHAISEPAAPTTRVTRWLQDHTYLYPIARAHWRSAQLRRELKERDRQLWVSYAKPKKNAQEVKKEKIEETAQRWVGTLNRETKSIGAKLILVNIDTHPFPWLSKISGVENVEYIDLSPRLHDAKDIRFRTDPHYNVKGHRLVGEGLLAYFESRR